ncbi:MAG TPA: DsbA family protein [Pedomonas sp.]|uniref:DsbA family protein n=1 Tax=Pedomonas sp. TaxID=2976421 RepID=UPI002F401422
MKQRGFWLAAIGGVVLVVLLAQMLSRLGGDSPAAPPLPLSEAAVYEDPLAPAITPAQYDLTIVIYSDYQCPYCRSLDAAVHQLLQEDSGIRVVFRDWPLLGHGSMEAARAAIASQWQGKHLAFHAALMNLPARLNERTIRMAADEAGVDWERLERDLENRGTEVSQLLSRNAAQAAQLGLVGTPGMLIGRYRIPGAVDLPRLREIVRMAREEAASR